MDGNVKQTLIAVAITLVCVLLVCGMGGISAVVANKREVPIYSVDRQDGYISISFDAAWGADKTRQIMDICDEYNVKATFFLVGFWIDKYPEMVAEISSRGFEIGTHSETHPQMSKLSESKCREELVSSSKKIFELTGKPVTLFRPPFGDYNNQLLSVAKGLGLYTIQWSVDSLDWKGLSAREITQRVQKAESGDIILCHNNSDHILDALPMVLTGLRANGFRFVTMSELVLTEGYTVDNNGIQHKS